MSFEDCDVMRDINMQIELKTGTLSSAANIMDSNYSGDFTAKCFYFFNIFLRNTGINKLFKSRLYNIPCSGKDEDRNSGASPVV